MARLKSTIHYSYSSSSTESAEMFVFLLLPGLILADPILQTSTGKLHGFVKTTDNGKNSEVFFSVPFVKPPVGDLRFERPVPYEDRDAEVNATQRHPSCPQHKVSLNEKVFLNFTWMSEDCLYMNIFKPVTNKTNLPIVFYIFGGSFLHGSANLFFLDGDVLATESDVIYVNVNYRVGIFGFLASGGDSAPGNQGIWDILEGLRWVKKNAKAIGGNPDDITIWGQSAGAIVIGMFMTSPITENLFHRAILQSGATGTGTVLFKQNSPQVAARALQKLGCLEVSEDFEANRDEAIKCAKRLSLDTILEKMAPRGFDLDLLSWQPVFGDQLVPGDPFVKNQRLHSAKELLVTSTSSEGTLFVEVMRSRTGDVAERIGDLRFLMALGTKQTLQIPVGAATKIAYSYFDGDESPADIESAIPLMLRYVSDMLFICPIQFFTDAAEANGISVYRGSFEARPSYSPWPSYSVMGHGDDVPITTGQAIGAWKNSRKTYSVPRDGITNLTAAEVSWTLDTVRLIGDFLHKGKPRIPGSEKEWPLYTKANPQIVYMAPNNFTVVKGPKSDKCGLWEPYIVSSPAEDTVPTTKAPEVMQSTTESISENVIRRGKVLRRTQSQSASDIVSAQLPILMFFCFLTYFRLRSLT